MVARRLAVALILAGTAGCIIADVDWTGRACDTTCPAPWACVAGACALPHDGGASSCPAGALECVDFEDGGLGSWTFETSDGGATFVGAFTATTLGFAQLSRPASGAVKTLRFRSSGTASLTAPRSVVVMQAKCGGALAVSLRWEQRDATRRTLQVGLPTPNPGTFLDVIEAAGELTPVQVRFTADASVVVESGDAGVVFPLAAPLCAQPELRLGALSPFPGEAVSATIDDVVLLP